MKNCRKLFVSLAVLFSLFPGVVLSQEKSSDAAPVEATASRVERKSVFEDPLQPPYTDPFFPRTKRLPYRQSKEVAVVSVEPKASPIEQVFLKGIIGTVGKRLALINNYTFAAGESGYVKTPAGSVQIKVMEVKEKSAVIQVENDPEPKEIYLRSEP